MFIRPYSEGDEALMSLRADMATEFALGGRTIPAGPKWTLCDDGLILAIGGFEPDGYFHGWLLIGTGLKVKHWACLFQAAHERMAAVRQSHKNCIITARVSDAPNAAAFLKRLGFEQLDERNFHA
jgi:hypothetical protein